MQQLSARTTEIHTMKAQDPLLVEEEPEQNSELQILHLRTAGLARSCTELRECAEFLTGHQVQLGTFDYCSEVRRIVGSVPDTSLEKMRHHESGAGAEAQFRILHDTMLEGDVIHDSEGKIVSMNPAAVRILGRNADELLGNYPADFAHLTFREDGTPLPVEELPTAVALATGRPAQATIVGFISPSHAGRHWISASAVPLFRPGEDRPYLIHALFHDITELIETRQALQRAYAEIKKLKDQLQAEADYLMRETAEIKAHGDIIGRSAPILKVLASAQQVAATDAAVVITGETGTGKELIARMIHNLSRRGKRAMVCVNCAALPPYLVDNELFGREKGAYTGALTRQAGRFEVADGSTLFLDEVGELPLDTQAKLLRVLQNGEFERLGSTRTVHVDLRIIAATNKDLAAAVAEGKFRRDLYYRLNVFSIHIPPLRERVDDIPLFVKALVAEFTHRTGKAIFRIPEPVMQMLKSYDWPGNVRELRNVIERSVIMSSGGVLSVDLKSTQLAGSHGTVTLKDLEAAHIQSMLERSAWRIKGHGGAAEILGLDPSTLRSKMKKLHIANHVRKDEIPSLG